MAQRELKDLVIGVYSNYKYDDVKPWIHSLKDTGFKGDIVLIAVGVVDEVEMIEEHGVQVINVPSTPNRMIHMERFLHIYEFLKNNDYRYVVSTDVRDVIFQLNPIEYLANEMSNHILVAGEAIAIKDEHWNRDNIRKNFGENFYNDIKDREVCNVGILAGEAHYLQELCFYLYQMSLNRPDWVADQAAYNIIVNHSPWLELADQTRLCDGWAINAHVTNYEPDMEKFGPFLLEQRPVFKDGYVLDGKTKKPFYIVHQYDRVREWKKFYEEKYQVKIKSQYTPDYTPGEIIIRTDV